MKPETITNCGMVLFKDNPDDSQAEQGAQDSPWPGIWHDASGATAGGAFTQISDKAADSGTSNTAYNVKQCAGHKHSFF